MSAFCTACGAPRPPLVSPSVNMSGQPAQVGGAVARVFGWLTLVGGSSFALLVGAFFQWLFPGGIVGVALGLPLLVFAVALAVVLLKSGRKLEQSGKGREQATREQAIWALAARHGGAVTAGDVAAALGMTLSAADHLLTTLAKERPDHVAVDIGDDGTVLFRILSAGRVRVAPGEPMRVDGGHDVVVPAESEAIPDLGQKARS